MEGLKREQRINEDLKEKMKQFEEFDPDVLEKTKDQSKVKSTALALQFIVASINDSLREGRGTVASCEM